MLTRKLQMVIASLLLCCSSAGAKAAPISLGDLNTALVSLELALENIFSVPGSSLTDITFLPVLTVADPGSYLHVDTFAEQQGLLNFNDLGVTAGGTVVTAYVIETISQCGGPAEGATIGCASVPGNTMYLVGDRLLGSIGDELIAHELGHNFGLDHLSSGDPGYSSNNIMRSTISNGRDDLNAGQINTINLSSLIQAGELTILPVLVTAVPIPAALPLMLLPGLVLARFDGRRRRTAQTV